jgi:hypothetical protein
MENYMYLCIYVSNKVSYIYSLSFIDLAQSSIDGYNTFPKLDK